MQQSLKLRALGKYNLIASLAEGGMAKVYLGLMAGPAGFNKLLVIKVLNRDDAEASADDSVQLFWDEARLAARVIHPNIVHTYEVGEVEGWFFLAMEYLDGQTYRVLQGKMRESGLGLHDLMRIISETARGLHYAHELKDFKGEPLGVVHRDVSPQNVFITYDGQVKLLDFGIAKTADSGHKTKVGVIKGKLDYIAPEQLSGDHVDARSDIFALGVMLWEAVTGERFSGGRTTPEVKKIHARLTGSEPKVRTLKPDVPEALASIIDRAIALDPAQRWSDAGAFADALDAHIESTGGRPSAKNLAEAMNRLFAAERTRMRTLIDQQIDATANRMLQSGTTSILPHLGSSTTITPSGVRDNVGGDLAVSSSQGLPVILDGAVSSGALAAAPAAHQRRPWLGPAVVASLAAGIALAWLTLRPGPESPANAAAPSQAIDAPTTREAEPPTDREGPSRDTPAVNTVIIGIKTSPPDARVTLDGAELAVPFSGEFRRGTELHHLEATAKGYQPYKKLIAFGEDQTLDLVLQPAQARTRRSGAARDDDEASATANEAQPVSASPEPAPVTRRPEPGADLEFVKPRVKPTEIDTANPYAGSK